MDRKEINKGAAGHFPPRDRYISYSNLLGRVKLIDALPLKYPLSLIIDPCNVCNFRCRFCPTGHPDLISKVGRPSGKMSFGLFRKIIDDCKGMLPTGGDRIKRLFLDKDGEPLLNKGLFKMIRYAKGKEVFQSIETATNAFFLNDKTISLMVGSGLDLVRVSIEQVSDEKYCQVTGRNVQYNQIRRNIERLFREKERQGSNLKIHAKLPGIVDEREKKTFIRDFEGISDTYHVETLAGWSRTDLFDFTLGREVNTGVDSESSMNYDRVICNLPFRTMSVNWNGAVSICCVDWTWGTVVGDASKETMGDIWEGGRLAGFRRMHIEGRRHENLACNYCHFLFGQNPLDELDGHEERLKKIYGVP